jgi:hypothetical protein
MIYLFYLKRVINCVWEPREWVPRCSSMKRGNYHRWMYLSFIHHKSPKTVHNRRSIFLSWFDTRISFKNPKLIYSRSFEMIDNKPIEVQFLMLDGWEVHLYMIIPSLCHPFWIQNYVYDGHLVTYAHKHAAVVWIIFQQNTQGVVGQFTQKLWQFFKWSLPLGRWPQ